MDTGLCCPVQDQKNSCGFENTQYYCSKRINTTKIFDPKKKDCGGGPPHRRRIPYREKKKEKKNTQLSLPAGGYQLFVIHNKICNLLFIHFLLIWFVSINFIHIE
jgi:hypothetical protein